MAACTWLDVEVNGGNINENTDNNSNYITNNGESPLTSASNNNNNNSTRCREDQPQDRNHQRRLPNGKMLGKRMASEIELEVQTSTNKNDYIRFSRRGISSHTTASAMSCSSFPAVVAGNNHVASGDNFPIPNPNQTTYSTMLPSSTNLTSMTSGGATVLWCKMVVLIEVTVAVTIGHVVCSKLMVHARHCARDIAVVVLVETCSTGTWGRTRQISSVVNTTCA